MPRGKGKRGVHKGKGRHFTNEEELAAQVEKEQKQKEWRKAKGVSHLIETSNPNRVAVKQAKKVNTLEAGAKVQLSRKEREELEKQQAKAHYQKMHMEGKTEEARADLARLALIRKQREEAQKKRDQEKRERDAAAKAAADKLKEKKAAAKH
ncbi:hypothetical protein LSH36_46g04001 [Paralvinella palmiformis]|uniref:Casein kinase substrate phosphoprotein PP28 domain-containing protein n=1 Tax=Paralvinella palmiformis TaxID=53620 RepID=A0AAD9K6Q7_9ANNE|nr:hypothetical protein LSH36_46g04001 [Paralvinella palmiformis]